MSEDDVQGRFKSMNFTHEEREYLCNLVEKHRDIIYSQKNDSKTLELKNNAWMYIHSKFLESPVTRQAYSLLQLRRCWQNIKFRAKRGDDVCQKLLNWAETKPIIKQETFPMDDDAIYDDTAKTSYEARLKGMEGVKEASDVLNDSESIDPDDAFESALQVELNVDGCQHCSCDKAERIARISLMKVEKRQKNKLFRIKLQSIQAKMKREQEVHKLNLREAALRVENEKMRAEILARELKRQC